MISSLLTVYNSGVNAFSFVATNCRHGFGCMKHTSTSLNVITNKFFQLDEREDKDEACTEIFLRNDKTVDFGETDGPVPIKTTGTWELEGDSFKMNIKRTFESGKKESRMTDMGEFQFDVERQLTGTCSKVGDTFAIEGKIHSFDEALGDKEVGYFGMLDTTSDKLDELAEKLKE